MMNHTTTEKEVAYWIDMNIGNLNTGVQKVIGTINTNLGQLGSVNQTELVDAFKQLPEAILASKKLKEEVKGNALSTVTLLTEQATLQQEQRAGYLKSTLIGLEAAVNSATGLTGLWATWGPVITRFSGI